MDIENSVLIITAISNLALAIVIYGKNRQNIINQIFFLFVLILSLWLGCIIIQKLVVNIFWGLVLIGLGLAMGSVFPVFVRVFPLGEKRTKLKPYLLFLVPLVLYIVVAIVNPHLVIQRIEDYTRPIFGPVYLIMVPYAILVVVFGLVLLLRRYLKATKIAKLQMKYLFVGLISFFVIVISFNVILPAFGINQLIAFGPLSSLLFVGFTAFAIVKHHLLGIKVILTETLVAAIGLILLVQATLARTLWDIVTRCGIFILFSFFGWQLIKSVLLEIKRREQIQALAKDLEKKTRDLEQANIYLKQLMKMKTEFLTVASHQLRTPVTIIRGILSMLVKGDVPEEKKDDYIKRAFEGSNRLEALVSDLLSATELEAGKVELALKETDIEVLIKEIMEELRLKAEEKNLEFGYKRLTKFLPKIKIDPMLMKEAITVLIDNAIIYTPKGSVRVFTDIEDKNIIISVKDTGIGITKEDKKKLYEKFARGKQALLVAPNGTGLGLYIAKLIVDLHKGKIEVKSEGRGKGSIFSIILSLT